MAIISKIRVNGIDYDINADTLDGYHAGDFGLTSARTFNEITITNDAVGDIPLTVNAITSTTAHLQDWKVNNTAVGSITADGGAYLAGTANIGSITARTAYDAGTAYTVGTVVSYNNKVYICRKATTAGTIPTTTANWIEIGLDSRFNALIGTGNAATIWNNGSDLVLESDTGNLNFVAVGNVPLRIFSHIATAGGIQSGASVPFHFNVLSTTEQAIGAFSDYTGTAWRARGASVGLLHFNAGAWELTSETGKSIGATYTPTSRLYIAADGKVGINTAAPVSLLEVKGAAVNTGNGDILTINQTSATTGYYSSLAFAQGITNIGARIVSGNSGSYYGYLSFQVHSDVAASLNTVEKLRIDADGKITIPYFTSAGFVKTSAAGVLSVDTNTYLTSASTLDASKLSGTIPSAVLGNSTVYIGTTAVALNRASATLALTGITHSIGQYTSALVSTDLNAILGNGQFGWTNTATNTPATYGQGINIVSSGTAHNNTDNWITQLGFSTVGNTAYFRSKANTGAWGSWYTFYHTGNKPTATDVGLGNVTNDKQIVATASRTVGYIPTWANVDGASLANGYGVQTTLSSSTTDLVRADAIYNALATVVRLI